MSGSADARVGRALVRGALVWGAYAIVQVLINGVVLDEAVVAGQIISGAIPYPPGHPHEVYYRTALSLAHFLSAGLYRVVPNVEFVAAHRNILFLFLTTYAPFALAVVLTRREMAGHVTAAIVVLGAVLRFDGLYPLMVFPDFYSNGHIGVQLSILLAAFVVGHCWRWSGFLFGFLPAMHATMALMAWPWVALMLAWRALRTREWLPRGFLPWAVAGGAVTAALLVGIKTLVPVDVPVAPYDVEGTAAPLRDALMSTGHRGAIIVRSFGYLVNPVLFFGLCAILVYGSPSGDVRMRQAARGIAAFGAIIWAVVYGAAIWRVVGTVPDIITVAMPSRFSNLTATMLVPLATSALYVAIRSFGPKRALVLALVLSGALLVLAAGAVVVPNGRDLVGRNLLFLMVGAITGLMLAARREGRRLHPAALVSLVAMPASLLLFWAETRVIVYFAAAAVCTSVVADLVRRVRVPGPGTMRRIGVMPVVAVAVSAIAALPGRAHHRLFPDRVRWDRMSETDDALREWMAGNTPRDELLLTPYQWWRAEAQVKFERPVLLELETLWISTYMPNLASTIDMMVTDLYGVDFGADRPAGESCDPRTTSVWCEVWLDIWRARDPDEWKRLSARYAFRYVLAAGDTELQLRKVFDGGEHAWSVYVID